jgi:hypothetical protein
VALIEFSKRLQELKNKNTEEEESKIKNTKKKKKKKKKIRNKTTQNFGLKISR